MGEAARTEVNPHRLLTGDVLIVINGETEPECREQRVLEIRISVKRFRAIAEVVIDFADQIVLDKGLAEPSAIAGKRSSVQHDRSKGRLLGTFSIAEEEQLILDDGAAEARSVLGALHVEILSAQGSCIQGVIPEKSERLAMQIIGSGAGGHVDRTGRSQVLRKIERGLAELKLFDRACRN